MSQKFNVFVVAAVALLGSTLLFGCSSDEDAATACTVSLPNDIASVDGRVTYSASVMGNGSVDSVEYTADSKPVSVTKPSLPFAVTIDVKEDDPIGITVKGSASNGGKVIAAYEFVDSAGGDPVQTSAECGH